jgi:hypothetical protein
VDLAAGTVAAGPALLQNPGSGQYFGQTIASYVGQLQDVLQRAAANDQATVATIGKNLPNTDTGFGSAGSPALPRSAVEAQKGRNPVDVKAWWDSLTPEQQEHAIQAYPDLVGALNGVSADDRDPANRIILDRDITPMDGTVRGLNDREKLIRDMADQGRLGELYPNSMNPVGSAYAELDKISEQRVGLKDKLDGAHVVQNRLTDPTKPEAFLLGFNAAADGRAIVAVGNPDTADNVLTYVPGTTSDLAGIGGDVERADRMAADANKYAPGTTNAAILWLDYDAPDVFTNAGSSKYADAGAPTLKDFQSGLRATHDGPPSHNTVLGHSYGSTVVGYASRDGGIAANDLIFVGSPGVGRNYADELSVENTIQDGGRNTVYMPADGHVYASTTPFDAIDVTGIGDHKRFGLDPTNLGCSD